MTRYRIKGMTCDGCARAVANAIRAAASDTRVEVDLVSGIVAADGRVPADTVRDAVGAAGFEFVGREP